MPREFQHTPECFSQHLGLWAILPSYLHDAVAAIRSGLWRPRADAPPSMPRAPLESQDEDGPSGDRYVVTADGVGILPLHGPMQKMRSKFGGVSTVDARRTLRAMGADPKVGAILLHVDSPGGHVSGTKELADDVAAIDQTKPVHAFIEDLGASAAFWVSSQARTVAANAPAMVGSLGTFGVLHDLSEAAKMEGVKVHVVSTGTLKGAGTPGAPVTEEHLDEMRSLVEAMDEHFRSAVKDGRDIQGKALEAVWTGKVWPAAEAKSLGLIDRVETFDAAVERLAGPLRAKAMKAKMAAGR